MPAGAVTTANRHWAAALVCCRRFETTAHSIAWTLYEIASNPDVQDKVGAGLGATLTMA